MGIPCSCLTLLLGILYLNWAYTQVLDKIINLDPLFEAENDLLKTYQHYINLQQIQLSLLKQQLARQIDEHEMAKLDSEHSSNPINAFMLIRRLTRIKQILTILSMQDSYENLKTRLTTLQRMEHFPNDEDLKSAALLLLHVQETYNLDTQSISRGELNGVQSGMELSVDDCYTIGKQSYSTANYENTVLWMKEAMRKYDRWQWGTRTFKWEIIEYMTKSTYKLGRFSEAATLAEELLFVFPEYQGFAKSLLLDSEETDNEILLADDDAEGLQAPRVIQNQSVGDATWDQYQRHKLLCRKKIKPFIKIYSKLKCRYVHKNNPYLFIAPLKEEVAYFHPRILLYREAIYDAEIGILRGLSTLKLEPSTVGSERVEWFRSSKSTWLAYDEHPILPTIKRRVEAMTSLNGKSFENLHITNYGIGGYYVPHFDFAQPETGRNEYTPPGQDRMATVLFYISDVKMGGATVFPAIDVAVWPEKGTAVFWENLHSSGVANPKTLHAACPVLLGSKWVATVWVRERDQIFSRPCDPTDATWFSTNREFLINKF